MMKLEREDLLKVKGGEEVWNFPAYGADGKKENPYGPGTPPPPPPQP